MGKQSCCAFDVVVVLESAPYEWVMFDLWGPAQVPTMGGQMLMLVVTDQVGMDCKV